MIRNTTVLDRGMARGLAAFRALALLWAWIGLIMEREHLVHRGIAILGLGCATWFTLAITAYLAKGPSDGPWALFVASELALGAALLVLDGYVYSDLRSQSLPWAWPAAGIIAAAVVGGARVGIGAAALMAVASFVGESMLRGNAEWTTPAASKSALYALAAMSAGAVAQRLRHAEGEIAAARSREEMARVLHDGVLQTLAVVSRRSDDDELRKLAADQERDLRAYVSGQHRTPESVAEALTAVVNRFETRHDFSVTLVVAEDVPRLSDSATEALAGAVGEALVNAAKYSGVDSAVVFAEPVEDEDSATSPGVFCTVRDAGVGFDPEAESAQLGLKHSIIGRIEEQGGRVEVASKTGRGTEVRIWIG